LNPLKTDMEELGEPDLELAGFKLCILGRQFPDSEDYWDGNWLVVNAVCGSLSSQVRAAGSFLHLSELETWLEQLRSAYARAEGIAELRCMEPNLSIRLELGKLGSGTVRVCLTPDHLKETHEVEFDIDQSYLPPVIRQLERILAAYPVRNRPPRTGSRSLGSSG
jgi:hypothetical protein